MAPKLKVSKEMIICAGYEIADREGIENVNCRALATKIGCSTQPVFSRFPNMDELKEEVFIYACNRLEQSIFEKSESDKNLSYIEAAVIVLAEIAREHSNLYKLIYLSDFRNERTFLETREKYPTNKRILQELINNHKLDNARAEIVFERLSLLCHGVCTVMATTTLNYTDEQVLKIINETLIDSTS